MRSVLQAKYETSGLDIVEVRAVWASLPLAWENDGLGDKSAWAEQIREKLVSLVRRERAGLLKDTEKRHPAYPRTGEDGEWLGPYETSPAPEDELGAVSVVRSGVDDGAAQRADELTALRESQATRRQSAALTGPVNAAFALTEQTRAAQRAKRERANEAARSLPPAPDFRKSLLSMITRRQPKPA